MDSNDKQVMEYGWIVLSKCVTSFGSYITT